MKATRAFLSAIPVVAILCFLGASTASPRLAQDATQKPAEKAPEKAQDKGPEKSQEKAGAKPAPKLPAEIELLETSVRFEADGSSRKEVHARVKINDELGVRQFAHLNFDFNRTFEQVEIPLVHITHPSGGTADVLPSAITDNPNPAVVNAPAYQDVRVKSLRILGLEPGDSLEYRVVTTVSHHPLAPDFWLEHTFDRTGVVITEIFVVDLPASRLVDSPNLRRVELQINPATPAETPPATTSGATGRRIYRWRLQHLGSAKKQNAEASSDEYQKPDIELSSYIVWGVLTETLNELFDAAHQANSSLSDKAIELTKTSTTQQQKLESLYDFVSKKISTVDLPLDATAFRLRPPAETLASGYATPVDKFLLLAALASSSGIHLDAALTRLAPDLPARLPNPSLFTHILTMWGSQLWLDPALEVAPFGLLSTALHGKQALWVRKFPDCGPTADCAFPIWVTVPTESPLAASQKVQVNGTLGPDGKLTARAHYTMRGDNELLLRVAFHQAPKKDWKNVAQLLELSDGFRGKILSATASDPYATNEPFSVEYELELPKLVDWSKKPVRISAILPLLGLPDPPAKPSPGATASPIDLGTPLDIEVSATLHLPDGTTAHIPTGTSVERDFATYSSKYSGKDGTLTATRHLNFILRQIPADRAADYNAFLRTVQNDESQVFTLERAGADATPPATTTPQKP